MDALSDVLSGGCPPRLLTSPSAMAGPGLLCICNALRCNALQMEKPHGVCG